MRAAAGAGAGARGASCGPSWRDGAACGAEPCPAERRRCGTRAPCAEARRVTGPGPEPRGAGGDAGSESWGGGLGFSASGARRRALCPGSCVPAPAPEGSPRQGAGRARAPARGSAGFVSGCVTPVGSAAR